MRQQVRELVQAELAKDALAGKGARANHSSVPRGGRPAVGEYSEDPSGRQPPGHGSPIFLRRGLQLLEAHGRVVVLDPAPEAGLALPGRVCVSDVEGSLGERRALARFLLVEVLVGDVSPGGNFADASANLTMKSGNVSANFTLYLISVPL